METLPNTQKAVLARAARRLDLPADLVAGLPRMELTGFSQLAIEQHDGIREYGTEKIVVGVKGGRVVVEGLDLTVRSMDHDQLVLTGTITAIRLEVV